MAGTKAGAIKRRKTMIARLGSEQAYLDLQRRQAAKGGSRRKTKLAVEPESVAIHRRAVE